MSKDQAFDFDPHRFLEQVDFSGSILHRLPSTGSKRYTKDDIVTERKYFVL